MRPWARHDRAAAKQALLIAVADAGLRAGPGEVVGLGFRAGDAGTAAAVVGLEHVAEARRALL